MGWFSFNGKIGRKDFIIRLIAICVSIAGVFYLAADTIANTIGLKGYIIVKSAIASLMVILCIPSITKRLRDIDWTIQLAWLYFAAAIFSVQNIVLFSLHVLGETFISATTMVPFFVINIAAFAVLLVLIFKRGVLSGERSNSP
jgi:uncharacterized membrane protein YhaH (DUF805 family)